MNDDRGDPDGNPAAFIDVYPPPGSDQSSDCHSLSDSEPLEKSDAEVYGGKIDVRFLCVVNIDLALDVEISSVPLRHFWVLLSQQSSSTMCALHTPWQGH